MDGVEENMASIRQNANLVNANKMDIEANS